MLICHPSQLFTSLRYDNNQLCRVTYIIRVIRAAERVRISGMLHSLKIWRGASGGGSMSSFVV